MVYDASVPPEQSSTLRIMNCGISEFDGKTTGLAWYTDTLPKQVMIPAGDHRLKIYTQPNRDHSNISLYRTLSYTFLAGHTYLVTGGLYNVNETWGYIVDATVTPGELVPDPSKPDATPIEGTWQGEKATFVFRGNEYLQTEGKLAVRGRIIYNGTTFTGMPLALITTKRIWHLDSVLPFTLDYKDDVLTAGKRTYRRVQ
jgi:hypothetical protein